MFREYLYAVYMYLCVVYLCMGYYYVNKVCTCLWYTYVECVHVRTWGICTHCTHGVYMYQGYLCTLYISRVHVPGVLVYIVHMVCTSTRGTCVHCI